MDTLDNPGWSVDIDLKETKLDGREFSLVRVNRSETDWLHCVVEDSVFKVHSGPLNLAEGLGIFRDWVRRVEK